MRTHSRRFTTAAGRALVGLGVLPAVVATAMFIPPTAAEEPIGAGISQLRILDSPAAVIPPVGSTSPPSVLQSPALTIPPIRHLIVTEQQQQRERAWKVVAPLRRKYPFQSLAERLKYETPYRSAAEPPLGVASRELLAKRDDAAERIDRDLNSFVYRRVEALRLLHNDNVEDFVKRAGFGVSRSRSLPAASMLESSDVERIPPEPYPELSAAEGSTAPVALPQIPVAKAFDDPSLLISGHESRPEYFGAANPWLLPPRAQALDFHAVAGYAFLTPARFGYIENINSVAGFEPHAFVTLPPAPPDLAQANKHFDRNAMWKIARLELVSLLKQETPRVYLSEHLPKMDELSSAKTRGLDSFEKSALEKLSAGEELESRATPNQIVMLGAIRAAKACTQCHDVPHGTLLGAFSYDLRRNPPIEVPKAALTQ